MYIFDFTLRENYPKAYEIAGKVPYSEKNSSLSNSLFGVLTKKTRFGESKHQAKKDAVAKHRADCIRKGESFNYTDVRLDGIYSHSTFNNYLRVGVRFIDWLDSKGESPRSIDLAIKRHGIDYLKHLEDRGLSSATVLQARAFMGKVLGKEIEYKIERDKEPTKGRQMSERFSAFREDLNQDLVLIAKATGGRRSDLEKLKVADFTVDKGIVTAVKFKGSKGGRDRISPILPKYQREVTAFYVEQKRLGRIEVFDTIHSKANIHAYRREYAQELYNYARDNEQWSREVLALYKAEGHKLPDGYKEEYNCRDGRTFDRKSLFIASQGLGHSRLDIIPNNYFR